MRTLKTALFMAVFLGVALPIPLALFKTQVLTAMGATPEFFSEAASYYHYFKYGLVFLFLSMVEINTLRSEGLAKVAAMGMVMSALLNAALDPIFIFMFQMGTGGAALATLLARFAVFVHLSRYYIAGHSRLSLKDAPWRPDPGIVRRILVLGAGVFLSQIGFSILALLMNLSLLRYGVPMDVSVFGIISRIYVFVTMPFLGLAQGFQPVVGYNLGAGNIERVKKAVRTTLGYSFVIGAFMLSVLELFPREILRLFTDHGPLIDSGVGPLRIVMAMTLFVGIQIIAYFFFLAIEKPFQGMLISVSRQVLLMAPPLLLLPLVVGRDGIWLAFPVADVLSIGLAYALMRFESLRVRV